MNDLLEFELITYSKPPTISVMKRGIMLSSSLMKKLDNPKRLEIMLNKQEKMLFIRGSESTDSILIPSSRAITRKAMVQTVEELVGHLQFKTFRLVGERFESGYMFNFKEGSQ
jgi:hypothetical protein